MNHRHNEFAPLNTSSMNPTRFPSPPINSNGGGESGIRGGTPRPRRLRPSPRVSPYPQFPPTHRPPMGLPMYHPPPPVYPFGSLPPMSPAPWLPYHTPAPVANYNLASHSPLCMRPITFAEYCGRTPPKYVRRRRRNRDENVSSGLSSLTSPQSADRMKPIETPVSVMPNEYAGENESHGGADDVVNVLLTDYMDPDKIFYVRNEDDLEIIFPGDSEDVKSSSGGEMNSNLNGHESPNLPPSPGNHHGVTNRILANPESSAPSVQELEERSLSVLEDEYKNLRIGANGLQEQLSPRNAFNEQLTVDHQLEVESGELMFDISEYDMSFWDSLDEDIMTFDPSQFDQQPQTSLDFNEHII